MDYDIFEAFEAIENELIESMMRNFRRHRAEEDELGYNWSQWQAEQLKSLEQYRKANATKFSKQFSSINAKVAEMLEIAREDGNTEQEVAILEAIQNGFKVPDVVPDTPTGEFFKVNNRKLDALIKATTSDLEKAETAILRRANDEYRSAIFNAQVYANTGAGTYEKAVDMACRDMLRAGLSCVEYKNGSRHRLSEYAKMAIRTANKRAYLYGEGEKRQEWGISTVVVNSRQGGCHLCKDYIGKVFIDDVYSGGKQSDGNYPLLSKAIEHGLFHPNCKDSTSTYFEGITTLKPLSNDEREELDRRRKLEAQKNYYDNQAEKCSRISKHSLDKDNKRTYKKRAQTCKQKADEIGGKLLEPIANFEDNDIIKLNGKLSNLEVRKWYISQNKRIPNLIDKSKTIEEQAKQACDLRNRIRTQARDLMLDQANRKELDLSDPNKSFEELVAYKMNKKGLSYNDAIKDILGTSTKTRKSINKKLGLEE